MPRETNSHSACWEARLEPDEVEGVLAKVRKEAPGVIVQVFSASRAPNPRAVEMISAQTRAAAKSGSTLAERPELDLLLRLAGTRQIGEAFQRVGYKTKGKRLFMVASSEGGGAALKRLSKRLVVDERFTELGKKKLTKEDLDAVERAALLAVRL